MMEFFEYGEEALLINFEQEININVNQKVIHLFDKISNIGIQGITFQIPAYCSLTIGFDSNIISYKELVENVKTISATSNKQSNKKRGRLLKIPVCYSGEYAPDLNEVQDLLQINQGEIIQKHTQVIYRIYMMGFLPGFAYMGKLPEELDCPRKKIPRLIIPAQSVGLAGYQTGIYPSDSPGGWQIIGRTPIPVFDTSYHDPFLFRVGDQVQFYKITREEYIEMDNKIEARLFDRKSLYA